jgi:hypothetical protein
MKDRRRYTGTKTLQTGWTVLVFAVAVVLSVGDVFPPLVTVAGTGGVWVLGLVAFGLRDRRHWQRLIAASTFDAGLAAHESALQKIVRGQSVSVTTDVPGVLSQAHLVIRANVEGVDASFTIRIEDAGSTKRDGVVTGDDTLDARFTIRGKQANVAAVLTDDVRNALLAVETPGVFTVTGDVVTYEIPFTTVSVDELDDAAEAAAALAVRLEELGHQRAPPDGE